MRYLFLLVVLLNLSPAVFSQIGDYGDGNGKVVQTEPGRNGTWLIRRHIQEQQIGDLPRNMDLTLYSERSDESSRVDTLEVGDVVSITHVAEKKVGDIYSAWLHVETQNGSSGWLYFGRREYGFAKITIPYFQERWSIIDSIESSKTRWTIRKTIFQQVTVWTRLNIRDNPGVNGTSVIGLIVPPEHGEPRVNLDVLAVTEENDAIDGKTDRWLKIEHGDASGWIFGGYATVERGGPKYYTPETIIDFALGYRSAPQYR